MASEKARDIISFYMGGMGEYYKEMLTGMGYAEECERIDHSETHSQAKDAVTPELVDALTVSGNPLHCIRELRRRRRLQGKTCPSSTCRPTCRGPRSPRSSPPWRRAASPERHVM